MKLLCARRFLCALGALAAVLGAGVAEAQPIDPNTLCMHDGDPTGSGDVTAGDAQRAFQIAVGFIVPTFTERCAADCDGNDAVTAGDAQRIFATALQVGSCTNTCGADAYEPDNGLAAATPLDPGAEQLHSICPVGDFDGYRLTLAGEAEVTLTTAGPAGAVTLWLYDAAMTLLAFADGGAGFVTLTSALPPGDYYVEIAESGSDGEVPRYTVLLDVRPLGEVCDNVADDDGDGLVDCADPDCAAADPCQCASDAWEPDDNQYATPLVPDVTQVHSLCPANDIDWYYFDLDAAHWTLIDTYGDAGDTQLWLFDGAFNLVGYDDDGGSGGFALLALNLAPGRYFVAVDEAGNDAPVQAYGIWLTLDLEVCYNGLDDDFDHLLDCADPDCTGYPSCLFESCGPSLPPITCGAGVTGSTAGLPDALSTYNCSPWWFAAGERVYAFTPAATVGAEAQFTAGTPDGQQLLVLEGACDDLHCITNGSSGAAFTAHAGQTYYLVVDGSGAETEPFGFTLACGPLREFCTNGLDDDGDGQLDCADGECATAPGCGCEADVYEPDDDWRLALPVLPGVALSRSICPASDEDWAIFTLEAGAAVTLETAGAAGDSELWLLDPAVHALAYDDDGGSGAFSRLDLTLYPGTYFVLVRAKPDTAAIPHYTLRLTVTSAAP